MTHPTSFTGEQLTTALHLMGVDFNMDRSMEKDIYIKKTASLIAALAISPKAQLKLSLILLFLKHPEFYEYDPSVSRRLVSIRLITFQCYYTVAVWFQIHYHSLLDALIGSNPPLLDYFSNELGLEISAEFEKNLRFLGVRHQELSNSQVYGLGTYQHAFRVWLKGLDF